VCASTGSRADLRRCRPAHADGRPRDPRVVAAWRDGHVLTDIYDTPPRLPAPTWSDSRGQKASIDITARKRAGDQRKRRRGCRQILTGADQPRARVVILDILLDVIGVAAVATALTTAAALCLLGVEPPRSGASSPAARRAAPQYPARVEPPRPRGPRRTRSRPRPRSRVLAVLPEFVR
jgi:hypothetical protein